MRLSIVGTVIASVLLLHSSSDVVSAKKTFITDVCKSDDDCASGCCGFNTGKCAGAIIAQERDGGCGFGDAQPNANAAKALGSSITAPAVGRNNGNNGGNNNKNNNNGGAAATQKKKTFITDVCKSDDDCASGCCGFNTGKCAGAIIAQERDGGCGFGDAQPNANAAKALGSSITAPAVGRNNNNNGNNGGNNNKNNNGGGAAATQKKKTFITDVCKSDDDCASGCCGFNTGKCAGAIIAQERDGGCGFGDAQPNANAAKALGSSITAPAVGRNNNNNGGNNNGGNKSGNLRTTSPVAKKKTFITDVCQSDADCASDCCGFRSGKCAGPIVAQERDGGCGFGDAQPNDRAARALGFRGK